jgi:hypothetical protein
VRAIRIGTALLAPVFGGDVIKLETLKSPFKPIFGKTDSW